MARRRFSSEVERAISNAAQRWGIPLEVMRSYANIESGGDPNSRTGSYRGLFNISRSEFQRGGGQGSILDPDQNAMAAGRLIAGIRGELRSTLNREPTWHEVYMAHQQGLGGVQEHLRDPSRLAWQSMAATAEGRRRDEKGPVYRLPNGEMGLWSQAAIAGNIPRGSGVDWRTATSGEFMQLWDNRLAREGIPSLTATANLMDEAVPDMNPNPPGVPRDLSALSPQELTRMSPRNDSPYETMMGPVASVGDVAAATPQPIVQGVQPTGNIGSIFGAGGMPQLGKALSAAGKAIAGSGVKIPAMTDPATQMAALDSGGSWPAIPVRPQRRPPSVR
jgi:hypothetical protein